MDVDHGDGGSGVINGLVNVSYNLIKVAAIGTALYIASSLMGECSPNDSPRMINQSGLEEQVKQDAPSEPITGIQYRNNNGNLEVKMYDRI